MSVPNTLERVGRYILYTCLVLIAAVVAVQVLRTLWRRLVERNNGEIGVKIQPQIQQQ